METLIKGTLYVAEVTADQVGVKTGYTRLSYMALKGSGFAWPEKPDIHITLNEDILMHNISVDVLNSRGHVALNKKDNDRAMALMVVVSISLLTYLMCWCLYQYQYIPLPVGTGMCWYWYRYQTGHNSSVTLMPIAEFFLLYEIRQQPSPQAKSNQ